MEYFPHSLQYNSESLATFSLPAGLAYPVQIPAGVTLQTASGNTPVHPSLSWILIGINVI